MTTNAIHVHEPVPGTRRQVSGDTEAATCSCGAYIHQREFGMTQRFITAWQEPAWSRDIRLLAEQAAAEYDWNAGTEFAERHPSVSA